MCVCVCMCVSLCVCVFEIKAILGKVQAVQFVDL